MTFSRGLRSLTQQYRTTNSVEILIVIQLVNNTHFNCKAYHEQFVVLNCNCNFDCNFNSQSDCNSQKNMAWGAAGFYTRHPPLPRGITHPRRRRARPARCPTLPECPPHPKPRCSNEWTPVPAPARPSPADS